VARSANRCAWIETARIVGLADTSARVDPWTTFGSSSFSLRAIARPAATPAPNRTSERSFMSILPSRGERLA
jgi:hypothetical protein